jgi:hypothetical protein
MIGSKLGLVENTGAGTYAPAGPPDGGAVNGVCGRKRFGFVLGAVARIDARCRWLLQPRGMEITGTEAATEAGRGAS